MNTMATHQHGVMGGMGGPLIDSRPSIDILKVDRRNTVASNYLSKTVEGLCHGYGTAADNEAAANPALPFETAAAQTAELNPFSDRFLNPMITELGLQQNGFITWAQLAMLHPELHVQGVTTVNSRGPGQSTDQFVSNAADFNSTVGDRRASTDFYNRVMASLPGLMLTSLLVFARIHVTNMSADDQSNVISPIQLALWIFRRVI